MRHREGDRTGVREAGRGEGLLRVPYRELGRGKESAQAETRASGERESREVRGVNALSSNTQPLDDEEKGVVREVPVVGLKSKVPDVGGMCAQRRGEYVRDRAVRGEDVSLGLY